MTGRHWSLGPHWIYLKNGQQFLFEGDIRLVADETGEVIEYETRNEGDFLLLPAFDLISGIRRVHDGVPEGA
jgi:hypothetical protein